MGVRRLREPDVETFVIWTLIILGPSVAALAWLAWHSNASKNRDEFGDVE
jgi:hypothetical protein